MYGIKGWVHLIHKCLYQCASRFSYQTVKLLSFTSKANFCLRRVLYQIAICTNMIVLTKRHLAHLFLASAVFTYVSIFSSRRTCNKAWASFWYHLLFYCGKLRGRDFLITRLTIDSSNIWHGCNKRNAQFKDSSNALLGWWGINYFYRLVTLLAQSTVSDETKYYNGITDFICNREFDSNFNSR